MHQYVYTKTILIFLLLLSISISTNPELCSGGCLSCKYRQRICTACKEGFQLNIMGRCVQTKGNQNCQLFGFSLNDCKKCKSTFKLSNGTCLKDYSGCLQYFSNSCTKCASGKYLHRGKCWGILHCSKYQSSRCKQCEKGYILSNSKCFYLGRECARLHVESGACQACRKSFTLVGLRCVKSTLRRINCDIFDEKGCTKCKSGFGLLNGQCIVIPHCAKLQFINEIYTCENLPFGCQQINTTDFTCKTCFTNFQMLNETCVPNLPQNCTEITAEGFCSACTDRYHPNEYGCKRVSDFCLTYNSAGLCIKCTYSYFLNRAGICLDPYCIQRDGDTCITCRQYYKLNTKGDRCVIDDPNCLNSSDTTCFTCTKGFYASQDICKILPQNCLNANKKGQCYNCSLNYFLQLDSCHPVNQSIQHCLIYSQYSYIPECIQCEIGYMVSLGKCMLLPAHCNIFLSNGKCVICNGGFMLQNNMCVLPNAQQHLHNCQNNTNGTCQKCRTGHILGINKFCYKFTNNSCLKHDLNGICLSCEANHVISRKNCLSGSLIDINCKIYEVLNCLECYPGYFLAHNRCKLPNSDCKTFNKTNGGCLSCFPGFTLTNQQCVALTKKQNCITHDLKGNCIRCTNFFWINKGQCSKVSSLCRLYNQFTGNCTMCYGGFSLRQGSCIKKSFISWIDPETNNIVQFETCLQYDNAKGDCIECVQGYNIQNGTCLNFAGLEGADPNCKKLLNASFCSECYSGYTMRGGRCRGANPLCRTHDINTGHCTSCYDGYSLVNGKCSLNGVQQINPCLQNMNNICIKCRVGYLLAKGKCEFDQNGQKDHNIPFCRVAFNSSFCSLCQNGFYTRSGNCYQVSSFCQNYNPDNGQCITCKPTYILSGGSCITPALGVDPFCQKYSGVYCAKCIQGYYLKNFICTKIDPSCQKFNHEVNQCVQCSQGRPLFDICQ